MHNDVRTEVFLAVLLMMQVFWVITLCRWANRWAVRPWRRRRHNLWNIGIHVNKRPTRCNYKQCIFSVHYSTCFGWFLHPSSGAQITVSAASGTGQLLLLPVATVGEKPPETCRAVYRKNNTVYSCILLDIYQHINVMHCPMNIKKSGNTHETTHCHIPEDLSPQPLVIQPIQTTYVHFLFSTTRTIYRNISNLFITL